MIVVELVVARATEQGESGEGRRLRDAAEVMPAHGSTGEEDASRADRLAICKLGQAWPRLI